MRRFDINLHMGSHCQNRHLPQPNSTDLKLASTMDVSAPGDFAAMAKQHGFQAFQDAHRLLQAFIAASDLQANRARQFGFQ